MLNLLYFYISTFRIMCALSNMAVFCSSMIWCFPLMFLRYFMNDFEMTPVAPIITGITFIFTFHMLCIPLVRSLYFRILSASFFITFLSSAIYNIYYPTCFFSIIKHYGAWFILGFALVDSTVWLSCLLDLFLQVLVLAYTSVFIHFHSYILAYIEE